MSSGNTLVPLDVECSCRFGVEARDVWHGSFTRWTELLIEMDVLLVDDTVGRHTVRTVSQLLLQLLIRRPASSGILASVLDRPILGEERFGSVPNGFSIVDQSASDEQSVRPRNRRDSVSGYGFDEMFGDFPRLRQGGALGRAKTEAGCDIAGTFDGHRSQFFA
jgi:hypothetical protein